MRRGAFSKYYISKGGKFPSTQVTLLDSLDSLLNFVRSTLAIFGVRKALLGLVSRKATSFWLRVIVFGQIVVPVPRRDFTPPRRKYTTLKLRHCSILRVQSSDHFRSVERVLRL